MLTGKARGFKVGDFVHTGMFPGIIVSDVNTTTPTCEVWGFDHETGSAWAEEIIPLSWTEFSGLARRFGFDGTAYSKAAQKAINDAQQQSISEALA